MKNRSRISNLFILSVISASALFTACATSQIKTDLPFGMTTEVGPIVIGSAKTGEGEFVVTITTNSTEELSADVRVGRTEIGYNYNSLKTSSDNRTYSKFVVEWSPVTMKAGETRDFIIKLTNPHQVTKSFKITPRVTIKSAQEKWYFEIPTEGDDIFKDLEYLRSLNTTDYWHPRFIDENWRKYMEHIE